MGQLLGLMVNMLVRMSVSHVTVPVFDSSLCSCLQFPIKANPGGFGVVITPVVISLATEGFCGVREMIEDLFPPVR